MNAKLLKGYEVPVHKDGSSVSWRAIGLITALGFSTLAWFTIFSVAGQFV